jgi:hypothetical protein
MKDLVITFLKLLVAVLALINFAWIGLLGTILIALWRLDGRVIVKRLNYLLVLTSHIGNVLMGDVFNALFITAKGEPYGSPRSSISAVTGFNIFRGTLTSFGKTMKPLLDFIFEKDHAENAARSYE